MQWIPGGLKIADDLTERNIATFLILNKVLKTGIFTEEIEKLTKLVTYYYQLETT